MGAREVQFEKRGGERFIAPTMREFLDVVRSPVEPSRIPEDQRASLDNRTEKTIEGNDRWAWFGKVTLEEAIAMAESGWREGAKNIEQLSAQISAPLLRQVEKMVAFDVAPGEWVDPDRFLSGQPEVWGETVESEHLVDATRGKYVHIVVSAAASCSACNSLNCMLDPVAPETLQNRGAAICAAVDVLDALGFRVKVSLALSIGGIRNIGGWPFQGDYRMLAPKSGIDYNPNYDIKKSPERFSMSLPVKDYADPVDMDRLMFMVGHPAMLRRLIFSYLEHLPEDEKLGFQILGMHEEEVNFSYGYIRNDYPAELKLQGEDGDAVVYLPSLVGEANDYATTEGAKAHCHDILRKLGVRMQFD